MCGRVYITSGEVIRLLREFVGSTEIADLPEFEREEVFPTEELIVVRDGESGLEVLGMRWGVKPAWNKNGRPLINARSETVDQKSVWSRAFRERRCVLPVSGFYEWRSDAPKPKPRFRIQLDEPVMFLGGLWTGGEEPACTILTTRAGPEVAPLHNRQPVIIPRQQMQRWLDSGVQERGPLEDLLEPLDDLIVEPG